MRRIYLLLIIVITFISNLAQSAEPFYIYRNDGSFNAFFDNEVDSIKYSTFDLDSIKHPQYVTQVVYTTDTIYRIPLAVIDSVSFVTPETQYTEDVVKLNSEYLPYITAVDKMNITFAEHTPSYLKPKIGNILLYEGFSELFPDGFAGKVSSTTSTGGYAVACDSVALLDVYKQMLLFGDYMVINDEDSKSSALTYRLHQVNTKASGEITYPLKFSIQLENNDLKLSGTYEASLNIRTILRISPTSPLYINLSTTTKNNLTLNLSLSKSNKFFLNGDKKIKCLDLSFIIPQCPLLKFQYVCAPFLKGELIGNLECEVSASSSSTSGVVFENNTITQYRENKTFKSSDPLSASFNISGFVFSGLINSAYFGSVGNFVGVELNTYAGPRIDSNLKFDIFSAINKDYYNTIKDSEVKFSFNLELECKAIINLLEKWKKSEVFATVNWGAVLYQRYLFPEFDTPEVKKGNGGATSATIISQVSRNIFIGLTLGYALFDLKTNELIGIQKSPTKYSESLEFHNPMELTFTGLKKGNEYKVCPTIDFFGATIYAYPECKFKLDEEYIDLGLSVKWAASNIGANSPQGYGYHYTWKEALSFNLPTKEQFEELDSKCIWEFGTLEGINGYKITGPNGNSIFMPCSGWYSDGSIQEQGRDGNYWSSTPGLNNNDNGYSIGFDESGRDISFGYGDPSDYVFSIRTVSEK